MTIFSGLVRILSRGCKIRRRRQACISESLEDRVLLAATVGVYDENVVQPNEVDRLSSLITLAEFKNLVSTEFANDHAGVIDGTALSQTYTFGVSQTKTIGITPTLGTNWGIGTPPAGLNPISGTGAFVSTVDGGFDFTSLSFGDIQGGELNERVTTFGVTILAPTLNSAEWVTVTARTNGSGSSSKSVRILSNDSQEDVLVTFTSNELSPGGYFTSMELSYSDAPSTNAPLWFDDIAFVTSVVDPPNQRPVGNDDVYTVIEDTTFDSGRSSVLDNDTDAEGDPLTARLVLSTNNGSLNFRSDGTFTYTPNQDFFGVDRFVYTASDGMNSSGRTFVTLNVSPVNDAPIATNDSFTTNEDSPLNIPSPGVLANDSDVDDVLLSAALVTGPSHGALMLNADGSFSYTPNPNFSGTDFFTYLASDESLESTVATVNLTIQPVNDAPTVAPASFEILENSANGTAVGVVSAYDVDGDELGYAIISGNTNGAFGINPSTGEIVVANRGALDFEMTPQFELDVRVSDPSGASADGRVTIDLLDVQETPTAELSSGVLLVLGTNNDDEVILTQNGRLIQVLSNGELIGEFDRKQIDLIRLDGQEGTDTFIVDRRIRTTLDVIDGTVLRARFRKNGGFVVT